MATPLQLKPTTDLLRGTQFRFSTLFRKGWADLFAVIGRWRL
jgi:hypothetical protein